MSNRTKVAVALAAMVTFAATSCTGHRAAPANRARAQPTQFSGYRYLSDQTMPNSLTLIPPPPAPGSAAMARDEAARRAALTLHRTPRYALAIKDADRSQAATNRAFECASGIKIDAKRTPVLYKLLAKTRVDVRAVTYRAKSRYRRLRPYVANRAMVCTPSEQLVWNDGSYPSARGAVGWAYALVLAELDPPRTSMIMARGREFGQSRIVCDAEWQSDVDAGRTVAAAVVAQLQKVEAFRSDLATARREVMQTINTHPEREADCASEMQALASK